MTITTLEVLTMSSDSNTPAWDLRDLAIQRVAELKRGGVDAFWAWRGTGSIKIMVED